jgi:predicted O-methyltransferase YrrM
MGTDRLAMAASAPTPRLGRLLAAGPPLELDDWSLTPAALELVLARIGPDCERIVECGSGVSTIVIARLLAARGRGQVHALEHDPRWAAETRRRIEGEGLTDRATVVDGPLRSHPLAQPGCEWYDARALEGLPHRIDLLLVDGPPAGAPGIERARYPALPALASRLRPRATVILDDVERPGERWILDRWQRHAGVSFELPATDRVAIGCILRPSARGGSGQPDTERNE